MGKGAAMQELLNLPIGELERRCRHNGLSLVGGREIMVVRLLYLEEAEKQRGYELNDDLKYGQIHSSYCMYADGQKETNTEMESAGSSALIHNRGYELQLQGKGSGLLAPTIPIPQPELRAFTDRGKNEPMLTASKWAKDDNERDDEQNTSTRDLGLTYSSFGSENDGDEIHKSVEMDMTTDASVLVHPDSGITEEQRQMLRRIEVSLIEYHESLEERGVKDVAKIKKKFAVHRKHLESEFGLIHSNENASISKKPSSDRRERRDESRESSRKRTRSHSRSKSPQRKSSREKERENDGDRDKERHRDRAHELESERRRDREKSGSRERDDGRDKGRERDMDRDRDRRRRMK